jgi:hypothetical protein
MEKPMMRKETYLSIQGNPNQGWWAASVKTIRSSTKKPRSGLSHGKKARKGRAF